MSEEEWRPSAGRRGDERRDGDGWVQVRPGVWERAEPIDGVTARALMADRLATYRRREVSDYRVIRVRRAALSVAVDWELTKASVGDRVHLTIYGVPSHVLITELTPEWVEFRTDEETP